MLLTDICPLCSQQISDNQTVGQTTDLAVNQMISGFSLCQCGWTDTTAVKNADKKTEKQTIKMLIITAVVIVLMYTHLLNWGSYAVQIPFVKLGEFTGLLSKEGYLELADVCVVLNKWDCAKDALTEVYTSQRDSAGLAARARLETRLGETQKAINTYAVYFAVGGNSVDAMSNYGDLLAEANRNEEAIKAYESAISNSGSAFLPLKATTGLVHLLMKQGRYEEALTRINKFHSSADNATGYFNTEKSRLENYLSKQAKTSGASRRSS
jgi:tetratricopeptide (TPR) repeat protein